MSADTPITDTAVLAGALLLHADDDTQPLAWALLTAQQQDAYRHAAHRVLDAGLPHLTAGVPMHVEPDFVMGTRPDDSPWVISAEFAGTDVRVDAHGVLRLHGKAVAPSVAYKLAAGLLSAITWLESDGIAKTERAAALRGEQGE